VAQHARQLRLSSDRRQPVDAITTDDILAIVGPVWNSKNETASRLRGRIETVLEVAKTRGWRNGENPARWRGHLAILLPACSRVARLEHYAAMQWQRVAWAPPTEIRIFKSG